jgi:lipid-A-disaccharide synthase
VITAPARIAMAAGEVSGDLLAGLVLPALKARVGGCECAGIGGERMIAQGFQPWWHVRELSVRGYAEVLRHLPRLLRIRRELMARAIAWPATVFVGIDAPDFNLGVHEKLRRAGIRTVQYVAPTVWAWRPERIHQVKRGVEHLLAVFPFERKIFADAGIRTTYVGHPLAATVPARADTAAARTRLGIRPDATTVAVLPGSREAEVSLVGPPFVATIGWLQKRDASMQFVLPAADHTLHAALAAQLEQARVDRSSVHITDGRSHDCLEAADVVLVAGGTATLETMLFGKPMVIAYKVPWLTAWITRRKALIPYFGLPNILAGEHVVPEFVQQDVVPEQLGPALLVFLQDAARVGALRERFGAIRATLERDTPNLVAEAIAEAVKA